eukprot:g22789.t1
MASQRAQADLMKDALPCDGFRRDTNDEAEHSSSPVEELCANQLLLVDLLSGHALEFRFRVHHGICSRQRQKKGFRVNEIGILSQKMEKSTHTTICFDTSPPTPRFTTFNYIRHTRAYKPALQLFSQTKGKMIDAAHTFILYSFETGGPLAGAAQGIASVGSVSLLVLGSQKWMERRGGTLDASMPNGGRR